MEQTRTGHTSGTSRAPVLGLCVVGEGKGDANREGEQNVREREKRHWCPKVFADVCVCVCVLKKDCEELSQT